MVVTRSPPAPSARPGRMGGHAARPNLCGKQTVMSIEVSVRGITIPPDELSWRFSRSTGPGGQSVNTTDSRAELSFNLAESEALPPLLKRRALAALAGRLTGGVITI